MLIILGLILMIVIVLVGGDRGAMSLIALAGNILCLSLAICEMGGKLSFALTMLDNDNNGWILNSMHSRDGCYTYIKEIVRGESYIELSEEEAESLDQAVYQEMYDPDVQDAIKPQ